MRHRLKHDNVKRPYDIYPLPLLTLDVPEAPGKPEVTKADTTEMTVIWTPPLSDGGNKIIGYIIERKERFGTRWQKINRFTVTETTFRATELKFGNEYEFRVSAENWAGVGKPSEASEPSTAKPPYSEYLGFCSSLGKIYVHFFCGYLLQR